MRVLSWMFAAVVLAISCATPRGPTGGPPDRTPPVITETRPDNETVNFEGREVEFHFSKFMNRGSLQQALTIEPDLLINYEINWGRKSATIRFGQELPENTTVILKIGTELQDTRNNNLETPFDLALSTGPVIDNASISGKLRLAVDGSVESGMKVFLYREPFDLEERVNYVAQTDTGGVFRFSYLSEGTYKAAWVQDLNRNRIWERDREMAQPFHDSTITLEQDVEKELGTIFITETDTTSPLLEGVGLLTETHLRLRFNEEVFWEDDSVITVLDSLENEYSEAYPLYVPPEDNRVVFAQSESAMPPDQSFTLRLAGFEDATGNPAESVIEPFLGSAQEDTVRLRIIGDNREPGLFPDEPLTVGYSKFIDDEDVTDSLRVVEGERMIEEWPNFEIQRHRLNIYPEERWSSGINYQFLVWNPAREELRSIEPVIWQRNQLGSIEVTLADTVSMGEHHLSLFDNDGKTRIDTTFTGQIEVDQLPPLTYRVFVYKVLNGYGRLDPGTVVPFLAPEPYFVRRDVPLREGFTSELSVEFENNP
ncbi:MAG: Ig-like domain-containing protein [Balneolaceae bacterium]